eukprot:TRINITY_DN3035_c0_g2_i1.p2 TRINITY_DN3035_c0_g2~~TRINITY_DN3035_c0_g2_i1.p2  ORF type:complete len:147 (-),score=4.88 TRINITY_DN3035_c0_g2_i1:420-860(-)
MAPFFVLLKNLLLPYNLQSYLELFVLRRVNQIIIRMSAGLGRALLTVGGTVAALFATTVLMSSVTISVAQLAIKTKQKKLLVECTECRGCKKLNCGVCKGRKEVIYHPMRRQDMHVIVVCPLCGGEGEQKCLNCLGDGLILPQVYK